jgi:hypothetical protein
MNKKAALELGISTIVVMVIAMVVIGAGVSFIRTFFSTGTDSLQGAFEGIGNLRKLPDGNEPVVLSRETVNGRPGTKVTLDAGIYNPTTSTWTDLKFNSTARCTGENSIIVDSIGQNIPPGLHAGYTIELTMPSGQGTAVCALQIISGNTPVTAIPSTKQIRIEWGN